MTVTVRLFAVYADRLGRSAIEMELVDGATVGSVLESVAALPGTAVFPPAPLVAVNRSYARADAVLAHGDEVALIPPVAGG